MRGAAYMGFSFIVTSIVLVICSSYRIHISLRAHDGFSINARLKVAMCAVAGTITAYVGSASTGRLTAARQAKLEL